MEDMTKEAIIAEALNMAGTTRLLDPKAKIEDCFPYVAMDHYQDEEGNRYSISVTVKMI